ncbi:SNF2 family N-terminal domain-containing protein [Lineolata rhizophorae]|uniref:SNF2 family N-terminal domain-containing protein n=1 Tax=Lineolata rhizophorae TaxID=578093 RepID=A0A6A6NW88_9PEZI|nr:SNF2 family N-terminal domain-containing protein [Lineolata rhizophorae]
MTTSSITADTLSEESTPASSPPPEVSENAVSRSMEQEEEKMRLAREKEDAVRDARLATERQKDIDAGPEVVDNKFKALEYLLSQSKLYSSIMLSQMQRQEEEEEAKDEKGRKRTQKREQQAEQAAEASQRRATRRSAADDAIGDSRSPTEPSTAGIEKTRRGRPKNAQKNGNISSYFKKADVAAKAGGASVSEALEEAATEDVKTSDVGVQNLRSARQPDLVKGGTMRSYQLEGLEWLTSLYENGLNGILADEMGLGKTIQTIAFLAFLREKGTYGPFLIAAPLSTTSNWVAEFRKWTPDIPVVLYHGSKKEREEIRRKQLKKPGTKDFPVVVTSYEICMNDRKFLAGFGWKFIIIDEGHRIKNLNCRLIRELQSYQSANRLLITGTPLQNNLAELWSLLHFLMPTIFDKLESFESWFDFSALKERSGYEQLLNEERKQKLVASLHAILKPFLLRRVKTDVEKLLPRKREYILYAPLTPMQRELYQALLDGTGRQYLEEKAIESLGGTPAPREGEDQSVSAGSKRKTPNSGTETPNKSTKSSRDSTPGTTTRSSTRSSRRMGTRRDYGEISDREFFKQLERARHNEDEDAGSPSNNLGDSANQNRTSILAFAKRQIAAKKLQNPIMQLRLCCDSPYNFWNPFLFSSENGNDGSITPDETLISTSGKMLLLDSLLPELFRKGHKVLIFSQFKTQLDLLEMYAESLRGWRVCRIDGSVPQAERQAQITAFNKPSAAPIPSKLGEGGTKRAKGDSAEKPSNLFLLSTRAGGQGINLAAADTVILFDSDWNPQQDLQAQDRAHRIGQTRNVIVYRLATRGTVEQTLLESAGGKRRLEKLVIRKGGGLREAARSARGKDGEKEREDMELEELQHLLRREDGEKFDVGVNKEGGALLSKKDLDILTDRSEEAYLRAESGQDSGDAFQAVGNIREGELLEGLRA